MHAKKLSDEVRLHCHGAVASEEEVGRVRDHAARAQPVQPHLLQCRREAAGRHAGAQILLLPGTEAASAETQILAGFSPATRDCLSI